jgi:hypothetical protein
VYYVEQDCQLGPLRKYSDCAARKRFPLAVKGEGRGSSFPRLPTYWQMERADTSFSAESARGRELSESKDNHNKTTDT